MKIKVELQGRDYIEVHFEEGPQERGPVKSVAVLGCSAFMKKISEMRTEFGDDLNKWELPTENDHSSLLLKEMILKIRGQWQFPYAHEELCHCRSVSAFTVDQAIIAGAHTPEKVTLQTSASSACGTCRFEVNKIINYRLGR
ncbi:MAG: (2Fe-2S)-binding protein [Bdellovibrio sp.]